MSQEEAFDKIKAMGRRRARYLLYRIKNEEMWGGATAEKPSQKEGITLGQFKKFFEAQSSFTRFEDFAENWDLPTDKVVREESKHLRRARLEERDYETIPWPGPVAVVRLRGELAMWEEVVVQNSKTLPRA